MSNNGRVTHLSDIEGKHFPVLCVLIMIGSLFGAWMMHLFNLSAPNGFFVLFSTYLVWMIGLSVDTNAATTRVDFFKDDEYRGFVKRELRYVMNGLAWVFWISTILSLFVVFCGWFEPVPILKSAIVLFNLIISVEMLSLANSCDLIRKELVSEWLLNNENS